MRVFARIVVYSIFIPGDAENNEKTRQTAENKQTFDLTVKIEIDEKFVKTLKINKLLI